MQVQCSWLAKSAAIPQEAYHDFLWTHAWDTSQRITFGYITFTAHTYDALRRKRKEGRARHLTCGLMWTKPPLDYLHCLAPYEIAIAGATHPGYRIAAPE